MGALSSSFMRKLSIRSSTYSPAVSGSPRTADEAFPAPLPYPAGWFCLGFSNEISPGKVVTRPFQDEDVVLYRTRNGTLRAVDPYCPHLGAHLGGAGRVERNTLVCSFHNFAYDLDGACVATGYGTPPPRATLESRHVRERAGIVYVWYSHDGSPPSWEIPDLPADGFAPPSFRTFELAGHPQDVVENAVDLGHLSEFHKFKGIEIVEPISFDGHFFSVHYRWTQRFPGLGERSVEYRTYVHGLGDILVVAALPRLGLSARMWALPVPIAPWRVEFRFATSLRASVKGSLLPRGLGAPASRALSKALTSLATIVMKPEAGRDIPIWNHKAYIRHPRLVKGDGPIGEFRHWARQFYPQAVDDGDELARSVSFSPAERSNGDVSR
jgi:cholesterol 7-dehydrogenase